jgi:zinc transporter
MSATPSLAASSTYGADEHGVICGYLFCEAAPARPIATAQAMQWLSSNTAAPGGTFVWLHVNLSHSAAEPWLRETGLLGDKAFDAMRESSRFTRLERDGDTLFAVINDVTFDFSFDASDVASLWMILRENIVISARAHPLRSVDRLRDAVKRGEAVASPTALLDHLLSDQADELQRITRTVIERVDDIEDEMLTGKLASHGTELARLRRLMTRLLRLLAPEPSRLQRMLSAPPDWVGPADAQMLRSTSDEFAGVLRDAGSLQERIKLLQEESSARVEEQNNRSLFILTMVTVLALPLNLVAGLMGMNVGGVPLNEHPHGFWWVLATVAIFTWALGFYAVRKLGLRR